MYYFLELDRNEIMWLSMFSDVFYDSPLRLVQMICGSLLQHVTFDFYGAQGDFVAEFFALLSSNSSDVRLRSMHLKGQWLWDMTAYLSANVHLRHFTFTYLRNSELSLPSTFLSSLRRNGSLHTVEFKNEQGQSLIPRDDVSRFIQACTTRNRKVTDSMKSSFTTTVRTDEVNATITSRDHDSASATHKKSFPALCRVSHQAERMAPNSMLQGLLASSDMLDAISSSRVLGKRVAAAALEDV
jgi:hypothetical protein